jgi:tight adherence protein B
VTLSLAVLAPIAAALVALAGMERARGAPIATELGVAPPARRPTRPTLTPRELVVVMLAAGAGWAMGGVVGLGIGLLAAHGVRVLRRRREGSIADIVVQERAADAVGAIAAAVRSGSSLPQALRYAAGEASPPIRGELERLVADLDTGIAMDDALTAWAAHRPSPDTDLVVAALELHRRSGGDLPAVLDQVSATIRDRVGIAREVRSLTAQARLSAWILGVLPVGFFGFLWLTSRRDIEAALSTPTGLLAITVGLALEGGAFLWIRSLLEVE